MKRYPEGSAHPQHLTISQFRLLCSLGLRADDYLLDVGCGSLRAGRFFMMYLDPCHYCGLEPNEWLVKEGIEKNLGETLTKLKKPHFEYNANFSMDNYSERFDYVVIQSIFSHSGMQLIEDALCNIYAVLKQDGIIAATFLENKKDATDKGWVYPECVRYRKNTIRKMAEKAGLSIRRIPWFHPRQVWYLLAKDSEKLPSRAELQYLTGIILNEPDYYRSIPTGLLSSRSIKRMFRWLLPVSITRCLRRIFLNSKDK